jgi:hypothetical protein
MRLVVTIALVFLCSACVDYHTALVNGQGKTVNCSMWGAGWLGAPVVMAEHHDCVTKAEAAGYRDVTSPQPTQPAATSQASAPARAVPVSTAAQTAPMEQAPPSPAPAKAAPVSTAPEVIQGTTDRVCVYHLSNGEVQTLTVGPQTSCPATP